MLSKELLNILFSSYIELNKYTIPNNSYKPQYFKQIKRSCRRIF